ncbi:unnamed protein product [Rhizophagus irregularis]|nr:unnamed protein product [Rhizophagus irregularis]
MRVFAPFLRNELKFCLRFDLSMNGNLIISIGAFFQYIYFFNKSKEFWPLLYTRIQETSFEVQTWILGIVFKIS